MFLTNEVANLVEIKHIRQNLSKINDNWIGLYEHTPHMVENK